MKLISALQLILTIAVLLLSDTLSGQTSAYEKITINPANSFQTMKGFGGSLAYYENWVTSHPKKAEIYNALFKELSIDILRVRNAYGYDPGMTARVKEFADAAEISRGRPIDILSTSWGPPASLKSNNDRKNGGTLKYIKTESGVKFDYAGFAEWWKSSLDDYNANGIFPTYISIQNEPDFTATWESCLLRPAELITSNDTIAGYNKALDAVFDSIAGRENRPLFLGPENVGIGYNSVENYINQLDLSKLAGIGHHLYHGVNEGNPYGSTDFKKVGDFHPEVPHYQTEYSRGDWWYLIGVMYKSLHDENVVAYLYWDLAWTGAGLIDMDNPWNQGSWTDPQKGYTKTKEFYAFKQFSAFIHPNWKRIEATINNSDGKVLTFMSPQKDSLSMILINTSETTSLQTVISMPNYSIDEAAVFRTSAISNCELDETTGAYLTTVEPQTVATIAMKISVSSGQLIESIELRPDNPGIDSRMDSVKISADITPENAANKLLFWQITSGSELATLTQDGVLKALGTGDGKVTVRASSIDGSGVFDELDIEISNQVLVESIDLKASGGKISTPGGSIQFTATALPEEAFNKSLYWEITSGDSIASLSQTGLLTALAIYDGSVGIKVSATDGSAVSKALTISVTNQETGFSKQSFEEISIRTIQKTVHYQLPEGLDNIRLTLFSADGRVIYTEKLSSEKNSGIIDFSSENRGIYFLTIRDNLYKKTVMIPLF